MCGPTQSETRKYAGLVGLVGALAVAIGGVAGGLHTDPAYGPLTASQRAWHLISYSFAPISLAILLMVISSRANWQMPRRIALLGSVTLVLAASAITLKFSYRNHGVEIWRFLADFVSSGARAFLVLIASLTLEDRLPPKWLSRLALVLLAACVLVAWHDAQTASRDAPLVFVNSLGFRTLAPLLGLVWIANADSRAPRSTYGLAIWCAWVAMAVSWVAAIKWGAIEFGVFTLFLEYMTVQFQFASLILVSCGVVTGKLGYGASALILLVGIRVAVGLALLADREVFWNVLDSLLAPVGIACLVAVIVYNRDRAKLLTAFASSPTMPAS